MAEVSSEPIEEERVCSRHGLTAHVKRRDGGFRCRRCVVDSVTRRRRELKAILVREAGGACALCGYDRCLAALQFHHLDPTRKSFSLAAQARAEASKCVLLCANCHAEVETGISALP
jgi:hypothetical protein